MQATQRHIWTPKDDKVLKEAIDQYGRTPAGWEKVAAAVNMERNLNLSTSSIRGRFLRATYGHVKSASIPAKTKAPVVRKTNHSKREEDDPSESDPGGDSGSDSDLEIAGRLMIPKIQSSGLWTKICVPDVHKTRSQVEGRKGGHISRQG
ncbi:hypothetical protein P7C70_g9376, partial [Phenoliferia sp. Uapishka_3]